MKPRNAIKRQDGGALAGTEPCTITHPKKRAFLDAYAAVGTITHAAKVAGIHRRSHYSWLEVDREYALAVDHAREEAADTLEAAARRRAIEGVEEPVFHKGE